MGSTIAPPTTNTTSLDPRASQHLSALDEANRIRLARAAFKRRLQNQPDRPASLRLCADLLADPPEVLGTMPIVDLLTACRRIGATQAHKLLAALGIAEWRPIGGLTDRQRQLLIGMCLSTAVRSQA